MSVCAKFQLFSSSRSAWKVSVGWGGGVGWGGVCKVIFISNPTVVLRLGWGFDNFRGYLCKLFFNWITFYRTKKTPFTYIYKSSFLMSDTLSRANKLVPIIWLREKCVIAECTQRKCLQASLAVIRWEPPLYEFLYKSRVQTNFKNSAWFSIFGQILGSFQTEANMFLKISVSVKLNQKLANEI